MAQDKTFVFVFFKESKEPTDKNNPNTWLLRYSRARHTDIKVHQVLSVEEAIDIMLKEFRKEDKIGGVYIYTHSNQLGYVMGRLKKTDAYGGISKEKAKVFLKSSNKVSALSKYASSSTKVYFRGCNLGKDKEALTIWRDLFGGKQGFGSAPDMFVHWSIEIFATYAKRDTKVILKTQISHTKDVTSFVQKLKKNYKKNDKFWQDYEKKVNDELNKWLTERYNFLKNGGELPSDMIDIPNNKIAEKMREYFNKHSGLPLMYLMKNLQQTGINPWVMSGKVREKLRKQGAIFPEDSEWSGHIIEEMSLP